MNKKILKNKKIREENGGKIKNKKKKNNKI